MSSFRRFVLFIAYLWPASLCAQEHGWHAEFDSLVARGNEQAADCGTFSALWKSVPRQDIDMQSPSHTSIAEALGVLSALENYPPRPLAYNQARALFAAHFAEALTEPDQFSLLKRYGAIGDDCEPLAVMVHLSLLLKDTKVFPLTGSEVSRIRRLAERYLADDASLDYFILPLVRGEVLEAYVANVYRGADKTELLAETDRFLALAGREKERFRQETRGMSAAERRTAASLRPALAMAEKLAALLEPLVAKVLRGPSCSS